MTDDRVFDIRQATDAQVAELLRSIRDIIPSPEFSEIIKVLDEAIRRFSAESDSGDAIVSISAALEG